MQTKNRSRIGVAAILALGMLVAPRLAHAIGEQNGRIQGFVTEAQTNAPVPGADISVTGPNLPGGAQKTQSLDDGSYEIVELPPGRYDVEISYAGVKPIRRRVIVRQGEAAPLNISWSPELAQTEVTVVVEERHMTRPDSNQTGTVLTADSESKVASGRSYQSIALQIAGVNDVDGGGSPQVKGGLSTNNRWLVDGLDISDPVTNTFSANINFDSIGSVEVITGGMEAQYNSLGAVINLTTLAGSDEWHVDSSFYINNAKFSAGVQSGPQLYNDQQPFTHAPKPINSSYAANLNIGGPIIKHKLWFNFSFEYDYGQNAIQKASPLFTNIPAQVSNTFLLRLKLTWAPSDKHRITLSFSADPAFFANDLQDPSITPLAQDYTTQGGVFTILQWDYFKSKNMNFNIQTGFQYSNIRNEPQATAKGPGGGLDLAGFNKDPRFSMTPSLYTFDASRSGHSNTDDNTSWYNDATTIQNSKRYTFQFDPSMSLRGRAAGSHDAKIGIQFRFMQADRDFSLAGPDSRAYNDASQDGLTRPLQAGLCQTTRPGADGLAGGVGPTCLQEYNWPKWKQHQTGTSEGIYIQDRWKPTKRLTISPGLRVDHGYNKNTSGQLVSNFAGVGPRLGFSVDLTGDAKTIFAAYYGRSNEVSTLIASNFADGVGKLYINQFNAATGKFDPSDPKSYTLYGAGGYLIDKGAKTPHSDEVTMSLRREIFRNTLASVDYTYKRVSNIWEGVEVNQIWDPTGTRVVGYVNGQQQQINQFTTPDANKREYHGLDFIFEGRPTENWDFLVSYSVAWLYGRGAEELGQIGVATSAFSNPRIYNYYQGFLPEDIRHTLKVRASYTWKGLNLGGFVQWRTSGPNTKYYYNEQDGAYDTPRSPIGTDPGARGNDPQQVSEFRTPSVLSTNIRASYDFHSLIKQHLVVIIDMFNVLGLNQALDVHSSAIAAQYGLVSSRQSPFAFHLGLRYVY